MDYYVGRLTIKPNPISMFYQIQYFYFSETAGGQSSTPGVPQPSGPPIKEASHLKKKIQVFGNLS